jgi:DNA-binding response OmpR family regulator
LRLFLVEDDDRVAAAQHGVLRRDGFEVRRVGSAHDALESLADGA